MLAVASAYLAFMVASHTKPFDPGLEFLLGIGGWLFAALFIVKTLVTCRGRSKKELRALGSWRTLSGRWDLAVYAVAMLGIIVSGAVVGLSGNKATNCADPDHAAPRAKTDSWSVVNGQYLRHHPYDARGDSDPQAPWVPITRDEYVAEVGTRLRSAALFGEFSLVTALMASLQEEGMATAVRARDRAWDAAPKDLP